MDLPRGTFSAVEMDLVARSFTREDLVKDLV